MKHQMLYNTVSFANHTVDLECGIVVPKLPGSCIGQIHSKKGRPACWSEGIPIEASKVEGNQSQRCGNIVLCLQNR